MDSAAYLRKHGWRGTGHSLDATNNGLKKPLLVSKKIDVLGIGINKHDVSDQWWLRAFDASLKDFGTGKQSTEGKLLDQVRKHGVKRGGLYGRFVRGEGVAGTFEAEEKDDDGSKSGVRDGRTVGIAGLNGQVLGGEDTDADTDESESDTESSSDDSTDDDSSDGAPEASASEEDSSSDTDSTTSDQSSTMAPPSSNKRKADTTHDGGDSKKAKLNPEREAMIAALSTSAPTTAHKSAKGEKGSKAVRKSERAERQTTMREAKQARKAAKKEASKADKAQVNGYMQAQGLGPKVIKSAYSPAATEADTATSLATTDGLKTSSDFVSLDGTQAHAKKRKIPGLGQVDRYPTLAEKRHKKHAAAVASLETEQQRASAQKRGLADLDPAKRAVYEARAAEKGVTLEAYFLRRGAKRAEAKSAQRAGPTADMKALGFVVDTTDSAGLAAPSGASNGARVPATADAPMEPALWRGRVVKDLSKEERRARRDFMRAERTARKYPDGVPGAALQTRATRKLADQSKMTNQILMQSRRAAFGGGDGAGETADADGTPLPIIKVTSQQGAFDKAEVKDARRAARKVARQAKQEMKNRAEKGKPNHKAGGRESKKVKR